MYICDSYHFFAKKHIIKVFVIQSNIFLMKNKSCLGNAILCTDQSALGALYLLTSAAHLM